MSKAFTREQDGQDDEDDEPVPNVEPTGKNYMTPFGYARLRRELLDLLDRERPEVVRTVSWAASNGDRSENGDYIYGKRRLREIDRRIRFLNIRLETAEVVDPAQQTADRVLFGAQVTVSDENQREHCYRIVGVDELDLSRGWVSWRSPIAMALLNARVGDTVVVHTPAGDRELDVVRVSYPMMPDT